MINTYIFCQNKNDRDKLVGLSGLRRSVKVYGFESIPTLIQNLTEETLILIYPDDSQFFNDAILAAMNAVSGEMLIISSNWQLYHDKSVTLNIIKLPKSDDLLGQALYLIQKWSVEHKRNRLLDKGIDSLKKISKTIDKYKSLSDYQDVMNDLENIFKINEKQLHLQKTNLRDLCDQIIYSLKQLIPPAIRLSDKVQKIGMINCDADTLVKSLTETLLAMIGQNRSITGLTLYSKILPGIPDVQESVISLRFLAENGKEQKVIPKNEQFEEAMNYLEYLILRHGGELYIHPQGEDDSLLELNLPSITKLTDEDDQNHSKNTQHTILVVDDEAIIRELISDVLPEDKYNVLTAADGVEGLELFRKYRDAIDLVILDIVMPRMDGRQLFDSIKKIKPGLKVVITSGYSKASVRDKLAISDVAAFFPKPFVIDDLMNLLENLM